jgi:hypothetical protein
MELLTMNKNFSEFVAGLESLGVQHQASDMSAAERYAIGSVFGLVKSFINETNLVTPDQIGSLEQFDTPLRSFNKSISLQDIGQDMIVNLCRNCGINDNNIRAAVESVALCIHNYSNGYGAAQHFEKSSPSSGLEVRGFDTMFSKGVVNGLITNPASALESFGTDIGNVISDAKVAITVSILRYHRSALHRLIPNIPTDSNMVTYKVDHMEVYDLTKSRADNAATRYEGAHRVPFVELYNDPSPANTKLKPIVLRTANDAAGPAAKLLAENLVKIGVGVNMFDLSIDAGTVGYSHVDYTDIVADNVRIKTLLMSVTDGTVVELIPLNIVDHGGARMLMNANNTDSADRVCSMNDITVLDKTSALLSGAANTLLAGLSVDAIVKVKYSAAGQVNLKTSEIVLHGSAAADIDTKSGNAVLAADQAIFDTLTFNLVGYEPAAEFSEENVRKTTKAMRIMTKQVGYEIPGSSNYVVQYSLTQTRPESVIDGLTKLMSVGNDDRGIKLLLDTLGNVRDRISAEQALSSENYAHKIGQDFVCGQRVKPFIFMDTMNIDPNLKNMRSGEKWGDLRGYAEEYLLNVLSKMYRMSFYSQELGAGEKPVFSCLTSIPIKDSLLSIPHYHNHLGDTAADQVSDGVVEFRRTLPDGTVLNVITTTFNYFDDKILMVPVRPNKPQSVMNFAQNRERGMFLVQATPTLDNAILNSLIGNSREFPIVTNPVGALITVANLHTVFDGLGAL